MMDAVWIRLRYAKHFSLVVALDTNDRSGLGRFGMGLPNSSLSQAKRVTVTSWTNLNAMNRSGRNVVGSGRPIYTYLDADEIACGKMTEVPPPLTVRSFRSVCQSSSGTIVHWSNCDRLDFQYASTISRHISRELARRFRYFIAQGVTISVNDCVIKPFDPLFLRFSKISRTRFAVWRRNPLHNFV